MKEQKVTHKNSKGITLIALIITIVVLLILAVVTIGAIQESKIIAHAQNAAKDYNGVKVDEESDISGYETLIEENLPGGNDENAGGTIGEQAEPIVHNGTIPEGATYTAADGTVYNAGQNFPSTVTAGDIYVFEDYEYRYRYLWCEEWENVENAVDSELWLDGWGVRVIDDSKNEYSTIITTINGKNIVYMAYTFMSCESLRIAPDIPNNVQFIVGAFYNCKSLTTLSDIPSSVKNMEGTFEGCTALATIPAIPSNVYSLYYTFKGCTVLTGDIEINANPTIYEECFKDTVKDIKITGSASQETKVALAGTATNGNVSY